MPPVSPSLWHFDCPPLGHVDLLNRRVHFRIRDVRIPDPERVLGELYGDYLLQGEVIDVTDSGVGSEGLFVVVRVERLNQPLVVPVNEIVCVV